MSFDIEARLANNRPCLRILDAGSQTTLRLVWQYPRSSAPVESNAVHDLFRELFLLSLLRHDEDGVRLRLTADADRPADRCSR